MAMSAGTVVVADDESATGTGMARAIYDADIATLALPVVPILGNTDPPWRVERPVNAADIAQVQAARLLMLSEAARRANAYAAGIVTHITGNAKVTVSVGGLQRTPSPNNPDTATQAPASPVELPVS